MHVAFFPSPKRLSSLLINSALQPLRLHRAPGFTSTAMSSSSSGAGGAGEAVRAFAVLVASDGVCAAPVVNTSFPSLV